MGEAAAAIVSQQYKPRNPQQSQYYRCVEDHFESFELGYDERFSARYGFLRPYVKDVMLRYLDCGDLHGGFARIKCPDCGHERLLAFSCKRRHFCPSCHQKRVVEFGEWLCMEVVKKVPHRHVVFSIPKILRRYFLYDRSLLSDLSRCAWETLKSFHQCASGKENATPGAVIAIQSFGDFLGFNPHCHVLVSDGCFYETGSFKTAPKLDQKGMMKLFRQKVLKLLLAKGKITPEIISMLDTWKHTGFTVFCGDRIYPHDDTAMENLACYIIRASFSQERMTYLRDEAKVVYKAKKGREMKTFDASEWLAAMCSHIPNRGEQMVRYYGYYSNVCRGNRQKEKTDDTIPCIIEADATSPAKRKAWARLIQKIYEVDPLTCPQCKGTMKVISVIDQPEVVKHILQHLGLWEMQKRPPPKIKYPPSAYYADEQIPSYDNVDPDYPFEAYL